MRAVLYVLLLGLFGVAAAGALSFLRNLERRSPGPTEAARVVEEPAAPAASTRRAFGSAPSVAPPRGGVDAALADANRDAIQKLEAGELDAALELFQACYEEAPEVDVFARNLAEAHARIAVRDHEASDAETRGSAIERLGYALELNPARGDLKTLLARWRKTAAAERDFWRKITDHFELSFDGTREELMSGTQPLEEELESAYHEFGELFGVFPVEAGRPRFRVVLYRREEFDSVTGIGDWAGGVFDGTVRVPVTNLARERESLKAVLRHELFHAFAHEVGGTGVPGWLNEGLAQWLEPPSHARRDAEVARAEKRLSGAKLFTLSELAGSLSSWTDRGAIEIAYAESLAFVAYIERMFGERILFQMVAGCRADTAPEETFHAKVGDDLSRVLKDWAQ